MCKTYRAESYKWGFVFKHKPHINFKILYVHKLHIFARKRCSKNTILWSFLTFWSKVFNISILAAIAIKNFVTAFRPICSRWCFRFPETVAKN